jgi:hypothetical protein
MQRTILVVGPKKTPYLLGSYARAFEALGHRVEEFDVEAAIRRSVPMGRAGSLAFRLLKHEPWYLAGNRQLIVHARGVRPDLVVVPGSTHVRAGALAQIKAALPGCRLALLWPDTLLNLASHTIQALPLYDCVASYSEAALPMLRQLGARNAVWLPFAGDDILFKPTEITTAERAEFSCDVCFVGNPRPERERAIVALIRAGVNVKVWGTATWRTGVSDRELLKSYFQGRELLGADLGTAMRCAKLGLNVIVDTNFPAANMRFFEGPVCGALMLSSPCPELEGAFKHLESIVYFRDEEELVRVARELLRDDARRESIRTKGEHLVRGEHTYVERARKLLDHAWS